MQDFYFQVFIIVTATLITSFIGWMSVNTWTVTNKISSFETEVKSINTDLTSIADDIKALRKYDAQIAVLTNDTMSIKDDIKSLFERIRELETA